MLKHLNNLELNEVLNRVSKYSKNELTNNLVLNLDIFNDYDLLIKELNEVDDLKSIIINHSILPFYDNFNIFNILSYIEKGRDINLGDLFLVKKYLLMEEDFFEYIKTLKKLKIETKSINNYFEALNSNKFLLNNILNILSDDLEIIDSASPNLYEIRKKLKKIDQSIQQKINKLLITYKDYLNESLVVLRNDRFCLPIKETYKNKVKGIVHDISNSGQTLYIEPNEVLSLMSEKSLLIEQEKREILIILSQISLDIFNKYDDLLNNINLFLKLDFLNSKAMYAVEINGTLPNINNEMNFNLIKARHPLIKYEEVVPIDLDFDSNYQTLFITGSNTGGKTVALKTVGLLSLMIKVGLLIPVDEKSSIPFFDNIFIDIGDDQSISSNLSTFSAHLTKWVYIINNYTNNSLILIDEIGSGTDPSEGVALSIAIIEKLNEKKVKMIITTHFSELKQYAYENLNMKTASVSFDVETLKPLYKLKMDTIGSSYAMLIAKRLKMPDEVLEKANILFENRESDYQKIMKKLEHEKELLEKEKEITKDIKNNYLKEVEKYQLMQKEFMQKEEKILKELKISSYKELDSLKEELKEQINILKEDKILSTPKEAKAKSLLNKEIKESKKEETYKFAVGDHVFINKYEQFGKITKVLKKNYLVSFGTFEMEFKKGDLSITDQKEVVKESFKYVKKAGAKTITKEGKLDLDLRGKRYEDVKPLLDDAIDACLISNLLELRIIHGFGTGVVKKAVDDYIKNSKYIKSSRLGGEGEGLGGATIIKLK